MSLSTQDIEMVKQLARLECEDLRGQLDTEFSAEINRLNGRCDILSRNNRMLWAMISVLKEQISGSMERWLSDDFESRFKERVDFLIQARIDEERAQAEKMMQRSSRSAIVDPKGEPATA